ncbi:MAG: glutathione S-transferase family protein [Pseudomonadota bacterium]|nr:glutathione S-transferase family protein [Pseudomonadota bacterium]
MGQLINGKWDKSSNFKTDKTGKFSRQESKFNHTISKNNPDFMPESNRYHLYVSHACPWAHRVMIIRSLKELTNHIQVSVVCPDMLENGWTFSKNHPPATGDSLYGLNYLYQLYQKADPTITTRVTVPVLWDKKKQSIVNNESSQILRILNSEFNELTGNHEDYYPLNRQTEIDSWNDKIYKNINNGVYLCGFASTQEAYEEAIESLFTTLDSLDEHFKTQEFLVDNEMTEADIRLITTLIRFDCVYHTHFKCNIKRIKDYKYLYAYLERLRTIPAIQSTTYIDHIKRHYYFSHTHINPTQIIAKGPSEY